MKHLIFPTLLCLFGTLKTSAQIQQIDCWIPWNCLGSAAERPLNVGDRRIIMRFESPWAEGERITTYSVTSVSGTQWLPYATLGPGVHILDVTYDDPWPSIYYEHSFLALRFIDPVNGDTIVSTPIAMTTEPAPPLSINIIPSNDDSVRFTVDSETLNGGWGAIPTCPQMAVTINISGVSTEDSLVYDHTLNCVPGVATHDTLVFAYNGNPTQICLGAVMKRVDDSFEPAFNPYVIANTINQPCVDVGEISTGAYNASMETPLTIAVPNPCRETARIDTKGVWEITTANGQLLQRGRGPETINTGTWSPGVYLIRSGTMFQKLLRE